MLVATILPCEKHSELADRQWGLHRNLALDKVWAPPTMALPSEGSLQYRTEGTHTKVGALFISLFLGLLFKLSQLHQLCILLASQLYIQYIQWNKQGKCNGQATYLHITVTPDGQ